jgi:hypothetical protein
MATQSPPESATPSRSRSICAVKPGSDKSNQLFFAGANGSLYYTNSQFGIETIVKWP